MASQVLAGIGLFFALNRPAVGLAEAPGGPQLSAELNALEKGIRAQAGSHRAALDLLRLADLSEDVDPDLYRASLSRIRRAAGAAPRLQVLAGWLLAQAERRAGHADEAQALVNALGFAFEWRVSGVASNDGKRGFARVMPGEPSAGRSAADEPEAPNWRSVSATRADGLLSLQSVFHPRSHVCALAETWIESPRPQRLSIWIGGGGATKVYFNDKELLADPSYRRPYPDRHAAMVSAQEGPNRVVVKSCVADQGWGLYLRVGDSSGGPMPQGVHISANPSPVSFSSGRAAKPRGKRVESFLASFEQAHQRSASRRGGRAQAAVDLAAFVAMTGADDSATRRALELARLAARLENKVEHHLWVARLATERAERVNAASRALALGPQNPAALLLRARLDLEGFRPADAIARLGSRAMVGSNAVSAALLEARLYEDSALPRAAFAVLSRALEGAPHSRRLLRRATSLAEAASQRDQSVALARRWVAHDESSRGARHALIRDAKGRADHAELVEQIRALQRFHPTDLQLNVAIAEDLLVAGQVDLAEQRLRAMVEMAPSDPALHSALGRLLLRAGQDAAGEGALRRAIALKPQDAELRELLEQLHPEGRRDEAYALDEQAILALQVDKSRHPITLLQDLEVNTVFRSGLGSSFVQRAAQIHTLDGARRWRTQSIPFDPETQRVQIREARVLRADGSRHEAIQTAEQQLGEPWYRVYYDTRALVVVFPDLEPGDVVELRYRVDDTAPRNQFADYYGNLFMLQGLVPKRRVEYVHIAPSERTFHWNHVQMPGLQHDSELHEGTQVERFHAVDVPALVAEAAMPGLPEVAPYLHVSTYANWAEVAAWYWGLVHEQLRPSDALREVVKELTRDAADLEDKVRRIHHWVVRNTRYVALEFGIHGFLPYPVSQVVQRGFGDCKDKASLIYTMLQEAGIEAQLVLVRTRRNGAVDSRPASLAVFDHAIAYVPALDLYIDGTAEQSGLRELPFQDQGVMVLHVDGSGGTLRQTPVLKPGQRQRWLQVGLASTGSAVIQGRDQISGSGAAGYRARYQAKGTQARRFERELAGRLPGASVLEVEFSDLEDINGAVSVSYRAEVASLGHRDGGRWRISPSFHQRLAADLAPASTRRHPLELGPPQHLLEERVVQVPAGWQVVETPLPKEVDSPFGRLQLQVAPGVRQVQMTTSLRLSTHRVEAEDYPAFRAWLQNCERVLAQRLLLKKGGTP